MAVLTGLVALALPVGAPLAAQAPAAPPAPSPDALSQALRDHGSGAVDAGDLRAVTCAETSDAPGAFDCQWEQRRDGNWHPYTSWLALVGAQWTMLDAPIPVPDFNRGKLKPLAPTAP
ncbi:MULTISPECIES: hypothetical protein [unclassified Sphingobium]|uniref:hypothetical protein n=1 Tax=unclassified Sphingobium TaxID=2611147 RepID=UPI002224EB17|nr:MULTISPECIES: hypothetical protein [unclassified Sphingobium]MCW2410959.1 hypothetical protein [Sphingobium sp. B8D3D]MCW2416750.1 hypothetical protein [Sphingobium sp. B8D3A]